MKLEELLEALWNGDAAARDQLRLMGPAALEAVPALGDAVAKGPRRLRIDALFVLEGVGAGARAALPALIAALRDPDPEISMHAADTLGGIGGGAVDAVAGELDHDDWRIRQSACQALGAIGPAAANAVGDLLHRVVRDDRIEVRERAVWALGLIGDDSCLEPLADTFTEVGGELGGWIAEAFSRFGRRARPVADALRSELHRDDPHLALAAASALQAIETYEDAAVWTLVSLLQDGDVDVQTEAALILGDFGSKAAAAVPALRATERADDDELRAQATLAIAKIRPQEALRRSVAVERA